MILLDGKSVSQKIINSVRESVTKLTKKPHLVVILTGNDPASKIYVKNKQKAAWQAGIRSSIIELPEDISEDDLIDTVDKCNLRDDVTGILVQLPLPAHIDTHKVIKCISPMKDVDGFTPENAGKLATGMEPFFYPATPQGIIMLLDEYKIPIEGKDAVVIGRSNIVGKPMAQMLLRRNATVTICHSYTKDLEDKIKTADILISAVGKKIVRCKMVNKNSCVIDVGIYRDSDNKITGDVDFDYVSDSAGYISPVPGGVGPMTIASLMVNASKIYT